MSEDDPALIARCRRGERQAWEDLVERHGPAILAVLRSRLSRARGTGLQAEDLFQEFWARMLEDGGRRLAGANPSRPLPPYLIAGALNLLRRRISAEALRQAASREARQDPEDPYREPAASLLHKEELESLRRNLSVLAPRDRILLSLVDIEGLPHARVAEALRIAPDSVSVLAERARARLRALLNRPDLE